MTHWKGTQFHLKVFSLLDMWISGVNLCVLVKLYESLLNTRLVTSVAMIGDLCWYDCIYSWHKDNQTIFLFLSCCCVFWVECTVDMEFTASPHTPCTYNTWLNSLGHTNHSVYSPNPPPHRTSGTNLLLFHSTLTLVWLCDQEANPYFSTVFCHCTSHTCLSTFI